MQHTANRRKSALVPKMGMCPTWVKTTKVQPVSDRYKFPTPFKLKGVARKISQNVN